jgi:hypothetical protein
MKLTNLVTKPLAPSVHSADGAKDSWSAKGLVTRLVNVEERSNWLPSNPTLVRWQTKNDQFQRGIHLDPVDNSWIASLLDVPEPHQADIEAARQPNEADEGSAIEPFSQRVSLAHLLTHYLCSAY